MDQRNELIRELGEAWIVLTKGGGYARFVTLLPATLSGMEVQVIVETIYWTQHLTPLERITAFQKEKTFAGGGYLNDGTFYPDQKLMHNHFNANRAYDIQIWQRKNETVYLQWRSKDAISEWDDDKQAMAVQEWWEHLMVELDPTASGITLKSADETPYAAQ